MDTIATWSATEREELFQDATELLPALQSPSLIERDYRAMDALFMDEPPSFGAVIERLAEIEERVNRDS